MAAEKNTSEDAERKRQLRRIRRNEKRLCAAERTLSDPDPSPEALAALAKDVRALRKYYTSPEWKQDFLDDEAGLLPRDLRRGVLSEDGIDHVLETYAERFS